MIVRDSSGVGPVFCASAIRTQPWRLFCQCTVGTIARCPTSGNEGSAGIRTLEGHSGNCCGAAGAGGKSEATAANAGFHLGKCRICLSNPVRQRSGRRAPSPQTDPPRSSDLPRSRAAGCRSCDDRYQQIQQCEPDGASRHRLEIVWAKWLSPQERGFQPKSGLLASSSIHRVLGAVTHFG